MKLIILYFCLLVNVYSFKLYCSNSKPESDACRKRRKLNVASTSFFGTLLSTSLPSIAQASISYKTRFSKELGRGLINLPSDDFWYPPYLIGEWNTNFKFNGANFTNKFNIDELAKDNHIPGFSKYSIIFAPDIGKDVSCKLRFIELDSHPREDHPSNVRNLVSAFTGAIVDSAAYSFQKQPNWISSPANRWSITYHDEEGNGKVDLFTRKRLQEVSAGVVETTEFFEQTHVRYNNNEINNNSITKTIGEYALNWKFRTPASGKDQFVTVDELRKATALEGSLDIYVYLRPTDVYYNKEPRSPVGVFSYDITLDRIKGNDGTTLYPFVPAEVGPVELNKYFGY